MKTLQNNDRATERIRAGERMTVTGAALVEVDGVGKYSVSSSQSFGPYTDDVLVAVSAFGTVTVGVTAQADEVLGPPARFATDSSGNVTGLVDQAIPGGIADVSFIPRTARRYANGQPIPRVDRIGNPGTIVYQFDDEAEFTAGGTTTGWTKANVSGLDGIADTGYATQGSKTGMPQLMKVSCDGSQSGTYTLASGVVSIGFAGKAGLWVYYSPDSTLAAPSIRLSLSTTGTFPGTEKYANWNSNCLRYGWNYLVFDANQTVHPYGINTGGTQDIVAGTVTKFRFEFTIANGSTAIFYMDSLWKGWDTPVSRIMIGKDGTGEADLLTYKSCMDVYGWKGYLNFDVTGSNDMTPLLGFSGVGAPGADARIDTCYAAGWDVINHSLNHNTLAAMTAAQIRYVVLAQRDYQLANGWVRGHEFFSAAQNVTTYAQAKQIEGLGFSAIRGYQGITMPSPFGFDNLLFVGSEAFDDPRGADAAVLATWQARALGCINYGADLWMYGHNIVAGDGGDPTGATATGNNLTIYENSFVLFLAWLQTYEAAGQCKVVTPTEWFYGLR